MPNESNTASVSNSRRSVAAAISGTSAKSPSMIRAPTVPLAICGALIPLYLGFTTLNIYTQIGLVTLIGLISKHGILMVFFANGAGAASRFAIGIVVVMGMLIGTLFTLFVLPTVYSFIARDHRAEADSERAKVSATIEDVPAHA